ncbi:MAG: prepilin-type N-terminal cleavage/methylation domain-containing protein [FCB group bacterium]|nr:prepilin-type N-terminal cleavage/methylation domain-containing protein [FCB group bacterium]
MIFFFKNQYGFTLIEVIMVILIAGILVSIGFHTGTTIYDTAKEEETKQELNALADAIVGNPTLENNGVRTDFGYVGDVGALPPNLDALMQNPGGYTTWKGPYFINRFSQIPDDYKKDAWGDNYQYTGGITITSVDKTTGGGGCSGGGSTGGIVRRLVASVNDLFANTVTGSIADADGTPPGNIYKDSVVVLLTVPNGAGGTITKSTNPDAGGYFSFNSIPVGNHDIEIVYTPDNDTLKRFVSVIPHSNLYNEYYLSNNVWYDTSGSTPSQLTYVLNSDSLSPASNCFRLKLWIENNTGSAINIDYIVANWTSPTAYYKNVSWNGTSVRSGNPALGTGDTAYFNNTQTINNGQSVSIYIGDFHSNPNGGGPPVDMTNTNFSITFSDGSTINFIADLCTN